MERELSKNFKKLTLFFFRTAYHPYVIRVSLVCTRTSFVCHSYVRVCHPYVTRMHLYVILMSLVCTRMSLVCTCISLVCTRMSFVCHSSVVFPWTVWRTQFTSCYLVDMRNNSRFFLFLFKTIKITENNLMLFEYVFTFKNYTNFVIFHWEILFLTNNYI